VSATAVAFNPHPERFIPLRAQPPERRRIPGGEKVEDAPLCRHKLPLLLETIEEAHWRANCSETFPRIASSASARSHHCKSSVIP
jgi:hypothetical protein